MKTIYHCMFVLSIAFIPLSMGAMEADSDSFCFAGFFSSREQCDKKNPIIASNDEMLTFIVSDGQSCEIPLNVALHAQFIRSDYEARRLDTVRRCRGYNSYQNCPENYNCIDLGSLPIQNGVLNLSKDVVEKAFNCLKKGQKVIRTLAIEEIDEIFTVADFFGFPREKMRKLLVQKEKLCGQLDGEDQIRFELYWNSIKNLLHDNRLFAALQDLKPNIQGCALWLHNNIESLDGLDLFVQELLQRMKDLNIEGHVKMVQLSGHKLKTVDVNQILHYFPHIQGLGLRNNCITTVKLPKRLPRPFMLDLSNNKIKNLPSFKLGEYTQIMLQGNPLTKEARRRCLQATKPSFLESQRHRIKAFTDKQLWKVVLGVLRRFTLLSICIRGSILIVASKLGLIKETTSEIFEQLKDLSNYKTMGGCALIYSLVIGGVYYWFQGYNNNVHHKYQPGTILFDETDSDDEKKD